MAKILAALALAWAGVWGASGWADEGAHTGFGEGLGHPTTEWNGTTYRTILTPDASGGAMSIVASSSAPGGGPPRHIHENADEVFVVLKGKVEFWVEGERFERLAGQAAFVPRGVEHTFRVLEGGSGGVEEHLIILTPGGAEAFFHEMAEEGLTIPADLPQISEAARKHGMTFTGPPLSAAP